MKYRLKHTPPFSTFAMLAAVLFMLTSCNRLTQKEDNLVKTEHPDSIPQWIKFGRNRNNPFAIRKKQLVKAYNQNSSTKPDSLRLKHLSRIQWSFLDLGDSTWFRKTNKETSLLAQQKADTLRLAGSYWDLGMFFEQYAANDSAFSSLSKAQQLYNRLGNSKRSALIFYDMAGIQADSKDYTGSEVNLIKAIELLKPLKDNRWLYNCYNVLGTVSKDLKDFKKSLEYYKIAGEYLEKAGATGLRENALQNNIGVVYHEMRQFEKATSYFKRSLSVDSLRLKSSSRYARGLNNLAKSTYMLNDNANVESMFLESIQIRDSIQDVSSLAGGYFTLAEYYAYKRDTLKAIASAKKSRKHAKESSNYHRLLESLGLLMQLDQQNASAHGQQYFRLNDSLQQEERKIRNKFERIRFETDEVVAQNELLSRQRQLWTGIAGALLLLVGTTIIIFYQRAKNQKLKFEQAQQGSNEEIFNLMLAQGEKVEEGKKMEQKRVSEELHDGVLGKMLGARMMLLGLNKKTDPEAIAERAKAISILQSVEGEIRSISHELSHAAYQKIHNFILSIKDLIQTIQSASKINIEFDFTDELDWDALSGEIKINMYRMVQESLQNSVKHAACKNIYIDFHADESLLTVHISDDGKGFALKRGKKGIGMRNMASRIKKINGTWNIKSKVGRGTKVTFLVPLVSNDSENAPSIAPKKPNLQEV